MTKTLLTTSLLLLLALPVAAGTRNCTAAMVTAGICPSTSWVVHTIAINTADPDGAGPLLAPSVLIVNAFAAVYGYQATATCTADYVAAGVCTVGQLGSQVAVTKAQFADYRMWKLIFDTVRQYNAVQAMAAAEATARAQADPDIGN